MSAVQKHRSFLRTVMKDDGRIPLSLHAAVARGDEESCRKLVARGADVNATGKDGKTVIACLLLGESPSLEDAFDASPTLEARRKILSFLLELGRFSLYSLNAPQEALRRVTPLAIAAYLDRVDFVSTLLDNSHGLVSVDAVDMYGATPLMYAVRDGNVDVVQCLLQHGARPDLRDLNHRSTLQFALNHPFSLYLCEKNLRQRRAVSLSCISTSKRPKLSISIDPSDLDCIIRDSQSPTLLASTSPSSHAYTHSLIDAITSSDLTTAQSLLLSSVSCESPFSSTHLPVVNQFDDKGWSPIHYCVTARQPNTEILDLLFLFGADTSLFTQDRSACTPLHCLARTARVSKEDPESSSLSLYSFIAHLVRDLHAPLSVRDHDEETPIHIAAEHGQDLVVLMALLDCDVSKNVLKMRNSRGLTPSEVAKPEFLVAFSAGQTVPRPSSSASDRTIKPCKSISSMSFSAASSPTTSFSHRQPPWTQKHLSSDSMLPSSSILPLTKEILDDLDCHLDLNDESLDLDYAEDSLRETEKLANIVLNRFHQYVDDAQDELKGCECLYERAENLVDRLEGFALYNLKKPRGQSSPASPTALDSQTRGRSVSLTGTTLVGSFVSSVHHSSVSLAVPVEGERTKALYGVKELASIVSSNDDNELGTRKKLTQAWSTLFKPFSSNAPNTQTATIPAPVSAPEQQKTRLRAFSYSNLKSKVAKSLSAEKKSSESLISGYGVSVGGSTSQVCLVERGRSSELQADLKDKPRAIVQALKRDMRSVDEIICSTERSLGSLRNLILDAERLMSKTIKAREHEIESERLLRALNDLSGIEDVLYRHDAEMLERYTSAAPPPTPIESPTSSRFPHIPPPAQQKRNYPISMQSPTTEQKDAVKALRHLLLEDIPSKIDMILDDMEKSADWLSIIRGVVREFHRRTIRED